MTVFRDEEDGKSNGLIRLRSRQLPYFSGISLHYRYSIRSAPAALISTIKLFFQRPSLSQAVIFLIAYSASGGERIVRDPATPFDRSSELILT